MVLFMWAQQRRTAMVCSRGWDFVLKTPQHEWMHDMLSKPLVYPAAYV